MSQFPNQTKDCQSPANTSTASVKALQPKYSATKNDTGVTIQVDLPGVLKSDLSITSEQQKLKINAARDSSTPSEWTLLNQTERPNAYSLTLDLHRNLDPSLAKARLVNGVLTLEIGRREECQPRQISIED